MYKIYVIAIPNKAENFTLAAHRLMCSGKTIILKQSFDSAENYLKENQIKYIGLDELWETSVDYEELHHRIVQTVLSEAACGDVVFLVPEPMFDNSLKLLQKQALVEYVPGVSYLQEYLSLLNNLNIDSVFSCPASGLLHKRVYPKQNFFISELGDALLAGQVKLHLSDLFNEEMIVDYFFTENGRICVRQIPLYELDMQAIDHRSAVFIRGGDYTTRMRYDMEDFQDIIALLRGPDGCPWDKKQTHSSLREYIIEEAHELIGAITEQDMDNICEELGDVLLQVALHTNIAEENASFTKNDVTTAITQKMINRHAHIFGNVICQTAEDVISSWEEIKRKEKGLESVGSSMQSISKYLPTLLRAEKVQAKAAKAGMDFASVQDAAEKVREELAEVLQEVTVGNKNNLEMEIGDLLFSAVNVARLSKCNSDIALSISTEKFINRFQILEKMLNVDKKTLKDLTLNEIDVYWNTGKAVSED